MTKAESREEAKKRLRECWDDEPLKCMNLISGFLLGVTKESETGQISMVGHENRNKEIFYKSGLFFSSDHKLIKKTQEVFEAFDPDKDGEIKE